MRENSSERRCQISWKKKYFFFFLIGPTMAQLPPPGMGCTCSDAQMWFANFLVAVAMKKKTEKKKKN